MSTDAARGQTVLRAARSCDARDIVAAVRAGFTEKQLGLFIYGCQGIESYVEYELNLSSAASSAMYLVAERDGTVAGCADLRLNRAGLFLNYISVLPSYRALKIGTSLLADGIGRAGHAVDQLVLDVLEENVRALNWYTQLGLSRIGRTIWWEVSPPEISDHAFGVTGWPQAESCQQAFGFSTLTITTSHDSYAVGRLGPDWFRITTGGALADEGVWAALRAIDPKRRVLALVEDGAMPPLVEHRGHRLSSSVRLSARLVDLRTRLRY